MKSYAEQSRIEREMIEMHLANPDMTLMQLAEAFGYQSNASPHRVLSYYYHRQFRDLGPLRDQMRRARQARRERERAMAFKAEKEAVRLMRLPSEQVTTICVESRATRDERQAA